MGYRRVRACLVALAALACGLPMAGRAQISLAVPLSLASQTPFTMPPALGDPILRVAVVATNPGATTFDRLQITGALGPAFVSREAYEAAISDFPGTVAATQVEKVEGTLEPGQTRTFTIELDMGALPGVNQDDPKVYPLRIQLHSEGRTVGQLFTNAIHVVRKPEKPLRFTWWIEVGAPAAFGPDGRLSSTTIEAALASPGGALFAPVAALRTVAIAGTPVDLVIRPSLLDDLRTMADGYTRADGSEVEAGQGAAAAAEAFLELLRTVAQGPDVQVVALPLEAPSIPAMLGGFPDDLAADLRRQEDRGTLLVQQTLGVDPAIEVARPPGGLLDDAAIDHYVDEGVTAVLADATTVERPEGTNGKAPLPTASVTTVAGSTVDLVLPDPSAQALWDRVDLLADPVRASQTVLGELAMIWKQEPVPVPPGVRGIVVAPPPDLPPTIWAGLVKRLAEAPFLRPMHPQILARRVIPAGPPAALLLPATSRFSGDYVTRINALHRDVDAYASMLEDPGTAAEDLTRQILRAEAQPYMGVVGEQAGAAWLDPVAGRTGAAFTSTTPQVQPVFTFTGREGTVPLRMGDPGDVPLRVQVLVRSSQFDFPDGSEREVVLERPNQLVEFDVEARASGRNPIEVIVQTPLGRVISSQTIVVRTSAVNSVALLITGGAGVVLLLLYARRRRRRNP
jgi:hypothetical protein